MPNLGDILIGSVLFVFFVGSLSIFMDMIKKQPNYIVKQSSRPVEIELIPEEENFNLT